MSASEQSAQRLIDELVRSTGSRDAPQAIRSKAKELVALYRTTFGEPDMPLDVDVLASMIGIRRSDDAPLHSQDAELVPDGEGGVVMRVNIDRPETRKRFSIAHEIGHTFFPEYTTRISCRPDARHRERIGAVDYLETLCDIAASELLFPEPWFNRDAATATNAEGLVQLAGRYRASREATIRRVAETATDAVAAVFLIWKLKPTQKSTIGNPLQQDMFGRSADEQIRDSARLRIEYSIPSASFRDRNIYLPEDKSMPNDGPIYRAALRGEPIDDECHIEFGQASGIYRVSAVPLWTPREDRGSNGESAVVALVRPVSVRAPAKKKAASGPSLFGDDD